MRKSTWRLVRMFVVILCGTNCVAAQEIRGFTEPVREIEVAASESGTVAELRVRPGERIQAGTLFAVLDRDVLVARRNVAKARSESTAAIDAARIKMSRAQQRMASFQKLVREGLGNGEEFARARDDFELAKTELQAAEDEQRIGRLELLRHEAELKRREVRSPITGVVTEIFREPGEFVSPTSPVVAKIADLTSLRVKFFVSSETAMTLRADQVLAIRLPSHKVIGGRLDFVSAVTDPDSGTVRIDVLINNDARTFRSGMKCILLLNSKPPATPSGEKRSPVVAPAPSHPVRPIDPQQRIRQSLKGAPTTFTAAPTSLMPRAQPATLRKPGPVQNSTTKQPKPNEKAGRAVLFPPSAQQRANSEPTETKTPKAGGFRFTSPPEQKKRTGWTRRQTGVDS